MAELLFDHVSKRLGNVQALDEVTFRVREGHFYALLGPSGSGKTTVLRVIAGFLKPDRGRVVVGGLDVTRVPVYRRDMGLVFQNYALFPHLSVWDNVAFGLRMRKWPQEQMADAVDETLTMVGIRDLADRRPSQISGGQQQRVALARALVIRPKVLLLDEPLSALDRNIRQELQVVLKRVQRQAGVTSLIVTHDQEEALFLADEMLVLDHGLVLQQGAPTDIYLRPVSPFVANFVGAANVWQATIEDSPGGPVGISGGLRFRLASTSGPDESHPPTSAGGRGPVWLAVRPERVHVAAAGEHPGPPGTGSDGVLTGVIKDIEFAGPVARVRVDLGSVVLTSLQLAPAVESMRAGMDVDVSIPPASIRYFFVNGREAAR